MNPNPTEAEPLRSDTYRDELAKVAEDTHDDIGPNRLPTVQEIDAVLADLPDHGVAAPAADAEATA